MKKKSRKKAVNDPNENDTIMPSRPQEHDPGTVIGRGGAAHQDTPPLRSDTVPHGVTAKLDRSPSPSPLPTHLSLPNLLIIYSGCNLHPCKI